MFADSSDEDMSGVDADIYHDTEVTDDCGEQAYSISQG